MSLPEMRGVRLGDVYRDRARELWEVVGLISEPVVVVRNVATGETEHHVIGCPNWRNKWADGPLREIP